MAISKSFKGFLVLNWKDGSQRIVKKRPSDEGPYEVCVRYKVDLVVPDKPEAAMEANIELPDSKVQQAIAEEI